MNRFSIFIFGKISLFGRTGNDVEFPRFCESIKRSWNLQIEVTEFKIRKHVDALDHDFVLGKRMTWNESFDLKPHLKGFSSLWVHMTAKIPLLWALFVTDTEIQHFGLWFRLKYYSFTWNQHWTSLNTVDQSIVQNHNTGSKMSLMSIEGWYRIWSKKYFCRVKSYKK